MYEKFGELFKKWIYPAAVSSSVPLPLRPMAIANDWTFSVEASGMVSPAGAMVRGGGSISIDHEGGWLLAWSGGGGGSTPVSSVGLGLTVTDASSVENLKGPSVQFGGTAGVGWLGAGAEATIFTNSEIGETYRGLSVSGRANYPEPLKASIHTSVQTTGGWSGNLMDSTVDFAKWLWFGEFNE